MSLLKSWSVSTEDNVNFKYALEIPNNCHYDVLSIGDLYIIDIKLNTGQTTPSTTFVKHEEGLEAIDGKFNLDAKEGTVKRPQVRVIC